MYVDSKRYVKEHRVKIGHVVLVPQRKINKFTSPFRSEKFRVVKVKRSMILARIGFGHVITKDASNMTKVQENRNQGLEMDDDDKLLRSTEEIQKEKKQEKKSHIRYSIYLKVREM